MSRESSNEEVNGIVKNGFDYALQVWILEYIIQDTRSAQEQELVGCDIRSITNAV